MRLRIATSSPRAIMIGTPRPRITPRLASVPNGISGKPFRSRIVREGLTVEVCGRRLRGPPHESSIFRHRRGEGAWASPHHTTEPARHQLTVQSDGSLAVY